MGRRIMPLPCKLGFFAGMLVVVALTGSLLAQLSYATAGLTIFYLRPNLFE